MPHRDALSRLKLSPWALAIALLPLAVILISGELAKTYGMPDAAPAVTPVVDPQLETAARLRMLAAWLVMAFLGVGSLLYCGWELRRFDRGSVRWLLGVYALCVALGIWMTITNKYEGRAEHSIGEATICMAFGGRPAPADGAKPEGETEKAASSPAKCDGTAKFDQMWALNTVQLYLLLLVMPAVVLSAISSLATGGDGTVEAGARLKTHLYLSAALLVCGLLFLSALLRWPGASLRKEQAASYYAHVDGYLFYWGVAYSLLIAAFYLPVVLRLTARGGSVAAAAGRSGKTAHAQAPAGAAGDDLLKPLDLLKIASAVFAPVITALLGNTLDI